MLSFHIDWVLILTLVVTILLPVIVGLVTKEVTNANIQSVLLAFFSAITAFGTEVLAALNSHTSYDVGAALIRFLGIFVVAVATHYGFWKPTGVSAAVQAVGSGSSSADHVATSTPAPAATTTTATPTTPADPAATPDL